ncbi:MAG TPA: 4Fe-4S dicluster domain-containing protein [Pyrinomonadaceae bacterium]|jgi:Fe-S-cluster-containing dehydrogenase component/formate-dependent nitrite reductase membrane component NrfD|nr:4Fe-4S dicluster domain-containing protein [Pyrinomonadaceae bacterium]
MLEEPQKRTVKWAKVIDQTRCIGCHACTTACKSENLVPLSVTRTYVKHVDVGIFPEARRAHQVTRCNQCAHAPCVTACPTTAMFKRADGIVDFDKSICIGCKACMAACPYDAIFINPEDHSAEKCNFCAHRIDVGLEPACVVVCPTQSILIGDLNDTESYVSHIVNRESVAVRRPEKETLPKLFYKGAHQATLDPLAARRPEGGLFMWSEQQESSSQVVSGNPNFNNSSAAALLSYDVSHAIPWDWKVSLYTWTKGIASGVYLVAALMVLFGFLSANNSIWLWTTPIVSGAFLAITGGLLIWDLEHPERFYLIFTRPQWKSWLVKGAFIIAGYTLVLALHFLASWLGSRSFQSWLMIAGIPLSILSAVYTAYLFAQAKARDMWQNPLLPPHLLLQALLVGSAVLLLAFAWLKGMTTYDDTLSDIVGSIRPEVLILLRILAISSVVHLLMIWGEVSLTHPTAHARLAIWEMVRGRYKSDFWNGLMLSVLGGLVPTLALLGVINVSLGVAGAPMALVGLMLFENAYVQAGQSVPLA